MSIPDRIKELIKTFDNNLESYKKGNYNETQVRREFIDPFFEELGWDITNKQGYAEAYKDVIHEDAIKVGGVTKAPDYCFRIGGARKFFLEAKKPSVNIKEDIHPAYQLRRYGWSAKLPLSILTDFEELAVYDCRVKPAKTDKVSHSRILYLKYTDYADRWEEIAGIFSRDAILKGSFDKYVESNRGKKGTTEVDTAFLHEIENWRELLARNIALRNPNLSQRELNFAVQKTIDRIVFLRICEDRGMETYGGLMGLLNGVNVYKRLLQLFNKADEKYNSGLFHFKKEKDRENCDNLTPSLQIDDKPLKEIFKNLYYPESPYEFSVLSADILGQVYERFLGKVIRLTAGHQAKIEEKPEVRKAGGVYYTPDYIVNYIVKNTVGKLVEGKRPGPRGGVRNLKILDPACGSGSFLIGAYQFLLDWHRDQYINDGPENWSKGKIPRVYQSQKGEWRLTTDERKRILLNNIYGVDIDQQAVEVTKLSLLLKVLEGEDEQSIGKQMLMFQKRVLPDLSKNIKCGNSLIGPDFYNNPQMSFFDEEELYRVNAFGWNAEFSKIMKDGGFDAVIGNPPWGAQIQETANRYLATKYARVVDRMVDTYIYFIDKSLLISKVKGMIGLVIPATLLNQSDTKSVRQLLVMHGVSSLINLGAGIFGKGATNTTLALIGCKEAPPENIYLNDLQHCDLVERKHHLLDWATCVSYARWKQLVSDDPHYTLFVSAIPAVELLSRLQRKFPPFSSILDEYGIQRGVTPDFAEMHLIDDPVHSNIETNVLRKSLSGNRIHRFQDAKPNCGIIYTTKQTDIQLCPNALAHMTSFKSRLTCKEIQAGKHPWWSLHRPRNPEIFNSPKFIGVTTSRKIEVVYDEVNDLVVTDACYVFRTIPHYNHRYVLGILHSQLFGWLYKTSNQGDGRVIPQVKATKLRPLPIRPIDFNNSDDVTIHDKMINLVDQILELNKKLAESKTPQATELMKRRIEGTDKQIDDLVYKLYDLTDEEIKIPGFK
jgi:type I restriction-modification system DNA methylase subunit